METFSRNLRSYESVVASCFFLRRNDSVESHYCDVESYYCDGQSTFPQLEHINQKIFYFQKSQTCFVSRFTMQSCHKTTFILSSTNKRNFRLNSFLFHNMVKMKDRESSLIENKSVVNKFRLTKRQKFPSWKINAKTLEKSFVYFRCIIVLFSFRIFLFFVYLFRFSFTNFLHFFFKWEKEWMKKYSAKWGYFLFV